MTDEERQKLCKTLLAWASTPQLTDRPGSLSLLGDFIREAAEEIERLTKENGRLTQALIDKIAMPRIREQPRSDWIIQDD